MIENVQELIPYLDIASEALVGIIFLLGVATRFIPNEKLFLWGYTLGSFIGSNGVLRLGSGLWEKTEDFLINSLGEFFSGVTTGLNSDDPPAQG